MGSPSKTGAPDPLPPEVGTTSQALPEETMPPEGAKVALPPLPKGEVATQVAQSAPAPKVPKGKTVERAQTPEGSGSRSDPPTAPKEQKAAQQPKEVSEAAFRAAFAIAGVLQNLSKKDQKSAMQMAGIQAGLLVTTQFAMTAAVTAQSSTAGVPKGQKQGQQPPPAQPKRSAEVKAKQSEIASLNKLISERSAAEGRRLPNGHELLRARDQAFRDLQGLKGKGGASQ